MHIKKNTFGENSIAVISYTPYKRIKTDDIIFIHMSWGGSWAFKLYLRFFANAGYACHALDLRGHGKSGGSVEGTTMQDYVDDVAIVVNGLNVEYPIIIGHSMGGLIALMYAAQYGTSATLSLDGSPTLEVQQTSEEKTYPLSYTPTDAGMPKNPISVMKALPDIPLMRMMKMKFALGVESGVARSNRKLGVSIPRESLQMPLLFIGAENGTSLSFGIGIEKARAQAQYYNAPIVEVKGATHPGLLIGKHWKVAASEILKWLKENSL